MKWGYGWGWGCGTLLPRSWPASPPSSSSPLGTTWPWECPSCAKPPRLRTKAHICPLKCFTFSPSHGSTQLCSLQSPHGFFRVRNIIITDHIPGPWRALFALVTKSCFWDLFSKHSTQQVDQTCKKGRGSEKQEQINLMRGQNFLPRHSTPIGHVPCP